MIAFSAFIIGLVFSRSGAFIMLLSSFGFGAEGALFSTGSEAHTLTALFSAGFSVFSGSDFTSAGILSAAVSAAVSPSVSCVSFSSDASDGVMYIPFLSSSSTISFSFSVSGDTDISPVSSGLTA